METDLVSSVIKSVVLLLLFHWKLKVRIVPVVKSYCFCYFCIFSHTVYNASNVM